MSKLNLKKKRNFGGLFYYARHNKKRRYLSMKGKLKLVRRLLLFKKFKNFSRSLEGKSYNFLKRDSQQKRNFKLVGKFLFVPTLLKDYRGYNVESRYRLKRFLSVYGSHWYRHKKFWKRLLYVNYKLKRKMIPKISFRRRSNFKRLSNLFFFWFLLLYQDLYKFLMKII